jgi:hypothetical protein
VSSEEFFETVSSPEKISIEKVCTILAIPSLLHSYEIWTLKQNYVRKLGIAEMIFVRSTVGHFIRLQKK